MIKLAGKRLCFKEKSTTQTYPTGTTVYSSRTNLVYPSYQTKYPTNTNKDILDIVGNQNNDLQNNYSDHVANKQFPTSSTPKNPTASRFTNPIRSDQNHLNYLSNNNLNNPLSSSSSRNPTGFEWMDPTEPYQKQRNDYQSFNSNVYTKREN